MKQPLSTAALISEATDRPDRPVWCRRLACAVISQTIRVAAGLPTSDTQDTSEAAAAFLAGTTPDDLYHLTFWCTIAGLNTTAVLRWARADGVHNLPPSFTAVFADRHAAIYRRFADGQRHEVDDDVLHLYKHPSNLIRSLRARAIREGQQVHVETSGAVSTPTITIWMTPTS